MFAHCTFMKFEHVTSCQSIWLPQAFKLHGVSKEKKQDPWLKEHVTIYNIPIFRSCLGNGFGAGQLLESLSIAMNRPIRATEFSSCEELASEAEIFLSMDHPHVVRLFDVYEDIMLLKHVLSLSLYIYIFVFGVLLQAARVPTSTKWLKNALSLSPARRHQEEDRLSLVMECMEGGELFDRVREKKVYSEKDRCWH